MLLLGYPKEGQNMAKLIIVSALMLAISMMTNNATDANSPITEGRTLYTACAPMNFFVVGPDPEDSQKIGLTEQAVENAVESRLRTARLYAPPAKQERVQHLYVVTTIVGPAFHLQVELKRRLDLGYGHTEYATVLGFGNSWHARRPGAVYSRPSATTSGPIHRQLSAGE